MGLGLRPGLKIVVVTTPDFEWVCGPLAPSPLGNCPHRKPWRLHDSHQLTALRSHNSFFDRTRSPSKRHLELVMTHSDPLFKYIGLRALSKFWPLYRTDNIRPEPGGRAKLDPRRWDTISTRSTTKFFALRSPWFLIGTYFYLG